MDTSSSRAECLTEEVIGIDIPVHRELVIMEEGLILCSISVIIGLQENCGSLTEKTTTDGKWGVATRRRKSALQAVN